MGAIVPAVRPPSILVSVSLVLASACGASQAGVSRDGPAVDWTSRTSDGGHERLVISASGLATYRHDPATGSAAPTVSRSEQLADSELESVLSLLSDCRVCSLPGGVQDGSGDDDDAMLVVRLPDDRCRVGLPRAIWSERADARRCVLPIEAVILRMRGGA